MALKDIALDKKGDLYLNDRGDLEVIDSVRQAIQIKLRWIKGEWIFNKDSGTPYLENVLVKKPNLAIIEKVLKDQILQVEDVLFVEFTSLYVDPKTRKLNAAFTASTTAGAIEMEVMLGV